MSVMAVASSTLLHAVLARVLDSSHLAAYFLSSSLVMVMTLLGLFGMERVAVRLIAANIATGRPDLARANIGRTSAVAGVGLTFVAGVMIYVDLSVELAVFQSLPLGDGVLTAAGIYLFFRGICIYTAESFRGFHHIRQASWLAGPGINTVAVVLLFSWLHLGFELSATRTLGILAAAATLVLLFPALRLIKILRRLPCLPEGQESPHVLLLGLPLVGTALGGITVQYADVWIVAAYSSDSETAVYGAVARLVVLVTTPLLVVNVIVPPIIAGLWARGEVDRLERALRGAATLAGLPSALFLAVFIIFGGPILRAVFGEGFASGAPALVVLALGHLVNVWAGSCGLALIMTGHASSALVCTLGSGAAGVAISILLASNHGSLGVATGMASALALQNLATWSVARFRLGLRTHVDLRILRHPVATARNLKFAGPTR